MTAWSGWLRSAEGKKPGPWLRVCGGATWAECWAVLLRWKAGHKVEKLVNRGRHPERRRRPR